MSEFFLFLALAVFLFGVVDPHLDRRDREAHWMARPRR